VRYPRIIAHRCGGALAPENTLAGLYLAARLGCRAVEFDVMLSLDGVPVLMHDETLERTTDGVGPVAAYRYDDLRKLDAGVRYGGAFRGEVVPSLEQALAVCAELDLWANVEIKPSTGRAAETGAVVGRLLAQRWTGDGVVSSFAPAALVAARQVAPQFDYALLVDSIPAAWRQRLAAAGARALHVDAAHAELRVVAEIVGAGIPLACYTVNDRQTAARLFAADVAAVFTDHPDIWLPSEQ